MWFFAWQYEDHEQSDHHRPSRIGRPRHRAAASASAMAAPAMAGADGSESDFDIDIADDLIPGCWENRPFFFARERRKESQNH